MATHPLPSPRIPLHTCEDLFAKLEWEYTQLQHGWTEYCAFNFVITARHLYEDWVKSAGTKGQKARKGVIAAHANGGLLIRALRDIANASKHWELDKGNKPKQIVAEISSPEIADAHAYFITGEVPYIKIGRARPSMPMLAEMTVKCLDWIVNGSGKVIPRAIEDELKIVFQPLLPVAPAASP